ncbi:MAG: TonB-dependent receptor [Tannerella sp.]|jgi:iron complex outermembrane receptor protein|nr:TonB-dependent receptor [Tannerella sp.]
MKEIKKFNKINAFRFKRFVRKKYSVFNSMHKVVNIGVVASCVLTFAHVTPTAAQTVAAEQRPDSVPEKELELEEVTVTAARIETPVYQTARLVTVITKTQIEQAPVQSIQDLLIYASGIDVIQRGGHGVQADISIRGGSADQTAVLLNGINITNPHTGHYSFDLPINLSDIERVEVVHGPSALIYGSGAFAGGINIITKKEVDNSLYASVEAGMYASTDVETRGAVEVGNTKNSLSAGYRTSDGYTAHSDYRIADFLWQTRMDFNSKSYLDFQVGYNNKQYGANTFYSALYPNQYERTSTYLGTLKGSFGNALKIIPILYWSRHYDQFDLIKDSESGRNYHRGDTYGANLIFQYASRFGTTNVGGEWRREDILSSKLGYPVNPQGYYTCYDDRTILSATVEHTAEWRRWVASAGALMNHNTLLNGVSFYPSVSLAYKPFSTVRIYAVWSRSTRMPTFTDLFYTTETHNANEQLRPERSESVDLGIKYNHLFLTAYFTGYLMRGRDIIDWVRESGEEKWASWNLTEINKQGVEAGIIIRPAEHWRTLDKRWNLAVQYARMNQTCDSKGLESKYSLNYLRDKLTAQLFCPLYKGLAAAWHFRFQKRMGVYRRYENGTDAGLYPYPAFSTLDLKLNYVFKQFTFYVNMNNLYDTQYYDIGNVPQAGFWLMGGITYRIGDKLK